MVTKKEWEVDKIAETFWFTASLKNNYLSDDANTHLLVSVSKWFLFLMVVLKQTLIKFKQINCGLRLAGTVALLEFSSKMTKKESMEKTCNIDVTANVPLELSVI